MKNLLARLVLFLDRWAFYVFVVLMYIVYTYLLCMIGWTGIFIWLTSSLAIGIVLSRAKAVNWAMKTIANRK
jgi:hypothetical protein